MDQTDSSLTPGRPAQQPAAALALRPLSTGEVLDRTFLLYRRNFWLFAGIGSVPAAVLTLTTIVRVVYLLLTHRTDTFTPNSSPNVVANAMGNMVLAEAYTFPALLLFFVAYGLSHAATIEAVSRVTRGLAVSGVEAYRVTRGRWLRWVGVALRQFWSFCWPILPVVVLVGLIGAFSARGGPNPNYAVVGLLSIAMLLLLPGGFVWGTINFLRNALAMPAAVLEDYKVNAAMRRSRALVAGHKGRIFLALLLVYALHMVAGGIQVPMVLLAFRAQGTQHVLLQAIQLLVQFVVTTLITPVASIALCLFYVDERVRREGYDIELLMQRSFAAPLAPDAPPLPGDPAPGGTTA